MTAAPVVTLLYAPGDRPELMAKALRTRADVMPFTTGVDATQITRASRTLCEVTGLHVARNKAVVGKNAFAHEAGIHQHGVLNDVRTYEIMRPEDVGADRTELVLGKHSGRHAVADRARRMGLQLDEAGLSRVFAEMKRRADQIGEIDDQEFRALVERAVPSRASAKPAQEVEAVQ